MKLRSGLLLAVAVTSFGGISRPAAAVTVGSFDAGNCYAFNCNDSGSSVGKSIDLQQIYNASAVGAISFNQITFFSFPDASASVLGGDYNITFGVTTSPVGSVYPVVLTNVATFFDGTIAAQTVGATYSINGNSYSYNPADGNLVMEIVVSNQDNVPSSSTNSSFWADYTGTDVSRAYSGEADGGVGALVTEFSNTVSAVPELSTWAMLLLGFAGLGVVRTLRSRRVAMSAVS